MMGNDNERGVGERGVDKELAGLTVAEREKYDFLCNEHYYSREDALQLIADEAKPKQRVTYKRPQGEGTEDTS